MIGAYDEFNYRFFRLFFIVSTLLEYIIIIIYSIVFYDDGKNIEEDNDPDGGDRPRNSREGFV